MGTLHAFFSSKIRFFSAIKISKSFEITETALTLSKRSVFPFGQRRKGLPTLLAGSRKGNRGSLIVLLLQCEMARIANYYILIYLKRLLRILYHFRL